VHTEKHHVGEEITDCLVYLLRLADVLDVDLPAAVQEKMAKNNSKYPVSDIITLTYLHAFSCYALLSAGWFCSTLMVGPCAAQAKLVYGSSKKYNKY
jgi:hypothetical protein